MYVIIYNEIKYCRATFCEKGVDIMKNIIKRITAALVLIVFAMSFMPAFAAYDIPSYIRIGLYFGGNAKSEVVVTSEHGFYLGSYAGTIFSEEVETIYDKLTITFTDDSIMAKADSGEVVLNVTDTESGLGVFPVKGGLERKLSIGGEEFRGGLDFKKVGGKNVITNVVFLNNYLYGVISREMSPSWHQEALKAQAVCARNYAANNLNKHSEYGFDLCNTVCCQAYNGTRFETENSYTPVDDTSNQVLTYDGKLAQLYYCASMGGRTEDVKNVWGNSVPYLVSVDNSYEDTANIPNGLWTGSVTSDEATTIMRNKGYEVGEVTDIEVIEYTENGRALKMKVTGTHGSKVFEREACRTLFNTVTKSQTFSVSGNGEGSENVPSLRASDGKNHADKKINELVLLTATGRSKLNTKKLFVTDGNQQKGFEITETSGSGKNTSFTFEGTGWGHSIGMSQYGAKGMAEAGFSYVDILLHYFPGTNLENAY